MSTTQQPEALRLAALIEKTGARGSLRDQAAVELRRQYAELETLREKLKFYEDLGDAADDVQLLRMGYAAARLEIESLKAQSAAPQPGTAYAALSDAEIDRIVPALEPVSEDFPVEWALWKDRGRIRNELRASHGQAPAQAAQKGGA